MQKVMHYFTILLLLIPPCSSIQAHILPAKKKSYKSGTKKKPGAAQSRKVSAYTATEDKKGEYYNGHKVYTGPRGGNTI